MQVDPQDVINILAQRLTNEFIRNATLEAFAMAQEKEAQDQEGVGIPTVPGTEQTGT